MHQKTQNVAFSVFCCFWEAIIDKSFKGMLCPANSDTKKYKTLTIKLNAKICKLYF